MERSGNPGVLRSEERIPALRFDQIVSTDLKRSLMLLWFLRSRLIQPATWKAIVVIKSAIFKDVPVFKMKSEESRRWEAFRARTQKCFSYEKFTLKWLFSEQEHLFFLLSLSIPALLVSLSCILSPWGKKGKEDESQSKKNRHGIFPIFGGIPIFRYLYGSFMGSV